MPGSAGADSGSSGVEPDDRRSLAYVIAAGLAVLVVATIVVAVTSLGGTQDASSTAREAALRKLPPYWTVHRGETYSLIAQKTGLTVEELETFNPQADPSAIVPGQRLKLRERVPPPRPKRLGPRVHKVRPGESFGSIAAKTGKSIDRLQQLNPRLRPATLQPGDRVRLR